MFPDALDTPIIVPSRKLDDEYVLHSISMRSRHSFRSDLNTSSKKDKLSSSQSINNSENSPDTMVGLVGDRETSPTITSPSLCIGFLSSLLSFICELTLWVNRSNK